jgi:hypothetical protein
VHEKKYTDSLVCYRTILDELAMARRDAVARAFMAALTRGGRPIELQAHDSLRYIGDMLAWVHQACAGEKEMLESLFNRHSAKTSGKRDHCKEETTKMTNRISSLI